MRQAFVVVGLGFGDEGKGRVVDALVERHRADLVVRFNGGPQASHTVVRDGRTHRFHQFGAGSLQGCRTHLSRHMMVEPLSLRREAQELGSGALDLLTVDPRAPVLTPYHAAVNRARERRRGAGRHGSCGAGIGELAADLADPTRCPVLRVGDLYRADHALDVLREIWDLKMRDLMVECDVHNLAALDPPAATMDPRELAAEYGSFAVRMTSVKALREDRDVLCRADTVVFEGAQGVLLDEEVGFPPHHTWSCCTSGNAWLLVDEVEDDEHAIDVKTYGVLRTYATRHGAGPFPTEVCGETLWPRDPNNEPNAWQGIFRCGWFDAVLARYAVSQCPVDGLVLTHCDRLLAPRWQMCNAYRWRGDGDSSVRVTVLRRQQTVGQQERLGQMLGAASLEPEYVAARVFHDRPDVDLIQSCVGVPVMATSSAPEGELAWTVDAVRT
jgi:adenylosuccinate synthase